MKKILYYIPAIVVTTFYAFIAIGMGLFPLPIAYVWIALLIASGVLLSKEIFWGGFIGMLPGVHSIYMSTKDTGQVINIELPFGILILIFYVVCGGFVFYKSKKKT